MPPRRRRICRYLYKNRQRMRYDEYLAEGYPIASGVIEGACRHLVKDRMERAGMHWTIAGAEQAMLDVRSVYVSGQWAAFQHHRIAPRPKRRCILPPTRRWRRLLHNGSPSGWVTPKFLMDQSHRIRFVYTPKHSSWLNQVEIWFSILAVESFVEAVLRPRQTCEPKILNFINYFNEVMAKPFRWTFTGH